MTRNNLHVSGTPLRSCSPSSRPDPGAGHQVFDGGGHQYLIGTGDVGEPERRCEPPSRPHPRPATRLPRDAIRAESRNRGRSPWTRWPAHTRRPGPGHRRVARLPSPVVLTCRPSVSLSSRRTNVSYRLSASRHLRSRAWPRVRSIPDDVGEENGHQHTVEDRRGPVPGEELLDLVEELFTVAGKGEVIVAVNSH